MPGIIVNQNCPLCNADGYMVVPIATWKNFIEWSQDQSESTRTVPEAFPPFMKRLHSFVGGVVGVDNYWVMCPTCGGNKTVKKEISFEELKELLK